MLVETKARVGVFAIALGAYLPQFPQLVPEFEGQYADFKKTLPDTVEVIDGGIVTTKEQSMAAGDKFRAADVDLVILQLLTYATSYNMLPAVRDLDVPVVLVNVQKKKAPDYANTDIPTWLGTLYACGAVGEMVADLERAGKRHAVITGVVEGGDLTVQAEIEDWCRAAQVRRRFRDTNLAQIGRPYPGMMDLYIDETNLYNRMWLYTKQFDWEKMWAIADNITDEDAIRAKAQDILDTFDIEGGGTIEKVWDMAKYVVAFEQWVKDEKIAFVASHYDGFAQGKAGVLDSMLIPAFSMLIKQGVACAVEGDIKVSMAMSILKTISGCGQLSEMYSIDFDKDICIIGHSGSGDADISQAKKPTMKIVPVFHGKTGGGWLQGWHERNGGNLTYRMTEEDVAACRPYFDAEPRAWVNMGVQADNLAGEYFITTGSGKFFRNVEPDPIHSIGIVEINDKGDSWRIVWGLADGARPTSEFPSHFMNHSVRKAATNGANRVIYHCHATNVIALTYILPLTDRDFTRALWQSATECPVVFPEGVGVCPWMVPGGADIAMATSEKMKIYQAAVWAQHGLFASGPDFDITFGLAHTIEKSAEIYVKVLSMGGGLIRQTITDDDLRAIARDFGVTLNENFLD